MTMIVESEKGFNTVLPGRNCFENIRRAFDLHHPGESYLPTPVILNLGLHDDCGWIQYDLVSAKLQTLIIRRWSRSTTESFVSQPILSALHIRAPSLNHLDIYDNPSDLLAHHISTGGLPHLRSFKCVNIITKAMIQGLALLPHLEVVDLRLPPGPVGAPHSDSWAPLPFPSLRTLKIHADNASSVALFIQLYALTEGVKDIHISIDWRRHLAFTARSAPPFEGLNVLFTHGRFEQCLTQFKIYTYFGIGKEEGQIPPSSITFSAIAPLLSCSKLEWLTINAGYHLSDFNDSALRAMAAAWPQLEILQLTSYPKDTKPMLCTVKCLRYFARSCQQLAQLEISFSLTGYHNIPKAGPTGIQLCLTELDVQFSPIPLSSVPIVASFLKRLFPNLSRIGTASTGGENDSLTELRDAWRDVISLHHE